MQAQVNSVIKKVAMAVPKTMATASPDVVRVLSINIQISLPAELVLQIMPSAHELAVAVAATHVVELEVDQQFDVRLVE